MYLDPAASYAETPLEHNPGDIEKRINIKTRQGTSEAVSSSGAAEVQVSLVKAKKRKGGTVRSIT